MTDDDPPRPPGLTRTAQTERRLKDAADPDAVTAPLVAHHAMKRLDDPGEIASAARFLASDESTFVTGTAFAGWTAMFYRGTAHGPLSVNSQARLGQVLSYARRYDDAIREFRNALELDPNFVFALWHLGEAYMQVSRYDEAITVLEKAATLSRRNPAVLAYLGCAYATSERDREARELLKELTELSGTRYISPFMLAMLDVCLEDRESAFESMEKAFAERSYLLVYLAVYPPLDSLRDDPRFHAPSPHELPR